MPIEPLAELAGEIIGGVIDAASPNIDGRKGRCGCYAFIFILVIAAIILVAIYI